MTCENGHEWWRGKDKEGDCHCLWWIRKEIVIVYVKILSQHLPGKTESKPQKMFVRIAGKPTEIQSAYLQNAKPGALLLHRCALYSLIIIL